MNEPNKTVAERLRERAKEHREYGWELMREGDPALLEEAAEMLELYAAIVNEN